MIFASAQRVKVKRSSGLIEDDWYVWTDMEQLRNNPTFAFAPPETIVITVLKATDGSPIEEMLREGNQVEWISKKVTLTDLASWQEESSD